MISSLVRNGQIWKQSWGFIKKVSIAIVSAVPNQNIYSIKIRKSKIFVRDEESANSSEKLYHRPISKPVVEKQTLIKEAKKQKGYGS